MDGCTRLVLLSSVSESSIAGGVQHKTLLGFNLLMDHNAFVLWICIASLVPIGAIGIV